MKKNKQDIFNSWKSAIKKDLKILVGKSGFDPNSVQKQLQTFIKKADRLMASKDIDIDKIVKKLKTEHSKLMSVIDRTIKEEVKRANRLLSEKKEKLKKLQKNFEKEFTISLKSSPKKTTRKKTSTKKTTRKVKRKA